MPTRIHSHSISQPPPGSLQMLYMGGWIFSISVVHIHIPLSCKAVFYQMQPWNWVCMSTAQAAKHLAENPFHILKGCYSLSVPWLCAQMPSPRCWRRHPGLLSQGVDAALASRGHSDYVAAQRLLISSCSGWVAWPQLHYICLLSGAFTARRKSLCLLMIMQLIKEPIILAWHV